MSSRTPEQRARKNKRALERYHEMMATPSGVAHLRELNRRRERKPERIAYKAQWAKQHPELYRVRPVDPSLKAERQAMAEARKDPDVQRMLARLKARRWKERHPEAWERRRLEIARQRDSDEYRNYAAARYWAGSARSPLMPAAVLLVQIRRKLRKRGPVR